MIKFALILVFCIEAFAQRPGPGKCPVLNIVKDYKTEKSLGMWYVHGRYFVNSEDGGKCNKVVLSLNKDETIKVVTSQVDSDTGTTTSKEAKAKFIDKKNEAIFSLSFPSIPSLGEYHFSVLGTDYSSYSVVFACQEHGNSHVTLAWIHTRERFPKDDVVKKALDVFDKNGIDKSYIKKTNQKDCE